MKSLPPSASGWRPYLPPSHPDARQFWLFRPGALTAGLRQLGHVHLAVLREHAEGAPADEAQGMGLTRRSPCWVREVLMSVDGVDCVVARSLTPIAASHGVWQGMRRLRSRPLADMLYNDRSIERSAFVCRNLTRAAAFYETASGVLAPQDADAPLWTRRSVFWRQGQPLLVAECFLPGFWRRVEESRASDPKLGPIPRVAGRDA